MGLLDFVKEKANEFYAGGAPARNAVRGLLDGDLSGMRDAYGQVANLFSPDYMKQVKPMSQGDAFNMAIDINPVMAGIVRGYGINADNIAQLLNEKHPNINADLVGGDYVTLSKLIATNKNQGEGTKFMDDFTKLADERGIKTALSPSGDFGGNAKRLNEFYKRFGFVDNKGKNKDFSISEAMLREVKKERK